MTTTTSDPTLPSPTQPVASSTIARMAMLARLRLTPEETEELGTHLHTMVAYIAKLTQVNTDGVEPMAHAVAIEAPLREDRVTSHPDSDALLRNAPARTGDFFVVPRILD